MNGESLAYYERAANRALEKMGLSAARVREGLPPEVMNVPSLRHEAWFWDSLATACALFARAKGDDVIVGFRCLLQVANYAGQLGQWPGGGTGQDAYLTLRNHVEDLLRPQVST